MDAESVRTRLRDVARLPDDELDLLEGALLVATTVRPELDLAGGRAAFEALAAAARERLRGIAGEEERLQALLAFVYEERGFHGDEEEYDHPRNSDLAQVLERRAGLPITLAVLLCELGRRVGVPLRGVGFPGHFLVRFLGQPGVFLDPFERGRRLSEQDCRELFRKVTGGQVRFHPRWLEPASGREVLARMLRNLKGAFLRRDQLDHALEAITRLLLVDPGAVEELRDRGRLHLRRRDWARARADLGEYLERVPEAADKEQIEAELVRAQLETWSLN